MHMSAKALALMTALAAGSIQAAPVTDNQPFFNLEYRGINSAGWTPGSLVRFGANFVSPFVTNNTNGTTMWASQGAPANGSDAAHKCPSQGGTLKCVGISANPSPLLPNFASAYLADNPAVYRGTWYLNFWNTQNGTNNYFSQQVYLDPAATQAPKVANITMSGSTETPTFTWAPPPGAVVNGYRVNIFDKSLMVNGNNGQVFSKNLTPDQTSFQVDPAGFTLSGYGFNPSTNYMIEISLIQTKNGGSAPADLFNSNVQAIARMYADFTPTLGGGHVINLPVVLDNGSYLFNMAVVPNQTYYIDPLVAVGYDFEIGAGDPNFASADLPDDIGDGLYDIWTHDPNGNAVLAAHNWNGHDVFSFGADGVGWFRVTGIETAAGLDPSSSTAFVTGLTFTGRGLFTGTQTPITVDVPTGGTVPEPAAPALALMALAAAGLARRRSSH